MRQIAFGGGVLYLLYEDGTILIKRMTIGGQDWHRLGIPDLQRDDIPEEIQEAVKPGNRPHHARTQD